MYSIDEHTHTYPETELPIRSTKLATRYRGHPAAARSSSSRILLETRALQKIYRKTPETAVLFPSGETNMAHKQVATLCSSLALILSLAIAPRARKTTIHRHWHQWSKSSSEMQTAFMLAAREWIRRFIETLWWHF